MIVDRRQYLEAIATQLRVHPACALLGPRQVGKTTLARMFMERFEKKDVDVFDLENPLDLARLENPMLALSALQCSLVVIDEIQRKPELFPVLRVLIDQNSAKKFLILGSASRDLIRQSSETLAGRIGYIELPPFSLIEAPEISKLWLRGGFPRSFLAESDSDSFLWRQSYIATFLERDVPGLGFSIPPQHLRRFWMMLAHYHGATLNFAELSRSLTTTDYLIRQYVDILVGTFMIRSLQPWYENIAKRQVKSPKLYFRDSGILHALAGVADERQLQIYPRLGFSWEGFALEQVICACGASPEECYFWATHADAELDLLIIKNNKRIGFEVKYGDAPKVTKSMRIAKEDLKLDHLGLVYPGDKIFPLGDGITAYGLESIATGNFLKHVPLI